MAFLLPRRFAVRTGRTAGFGSKTSWQPISHAGRSQSPEGAERSGAPAIAPHKRISTCAYFCRRYGGLTAIGRRGAAGASNPRREILHAPEWSQTFPGQPCVKRGEGGRAKLGRMRGGAELAD